MNERDELLAHIKAARGFTAQASAVQALAHYDQAGARTAAADSAWGQAGEIVADTLAPGKVFGRVTAASDWLADFDGEPTGKSNEAALAKAATWYGKVPDFVKADAEEFGIQAEGLASREASRYGLHAQAVKASMLDYVGFMWRRDQRTAASGLDQVQQTVNPHEDPHPTPLPVQVFDTFAPEIAPINQGVSGTEDSNRAPLLQEIMQEGGGQGMSERPDEHMDTADYSGSYSEVPAGQSMAMFTPTVAIQHVMTLDDYLRSQAASGLNEIQQVVNPHEDPDPTPMPDQVAFPWLLGPDAYGTDSEDKKTAASKSGECSRCLTKSKDLGYSQSRPGVLMCPDCREEVTSSKEASGKFSCGWAGCSAKSQAEVDQHKTHGCPAKKDASLTKSAAMDPPMFEPGDHVVSFRGEGARVHKVQPSNHTGKSHRVNVKWDDPEANLAWDGKEDPEGAGDKTAYYESVFSHHPDSPKFKKASSLTRQADQYGASDTPHAVVEPGIANSPATTPDLQAGREEGYNAGLSGDRPTFADASSHVEPNVAEYVKGYQEGAAVRSQVIPKSGPASMGMTPSGHDGRTSARTADPRLAPGQDVSDWQNDGSDDREDTTPGQWAAEKETADRERLGSKRKPSDSFVREGARQDPDFDKAYRYASKWAPGTPMVTTGSPAFESGLYAGMADRPAPIQARWAAAHQRLAVSDKRFAQRLAVHAAYTEHLRTVAGSGVDLNATGPGTSPDPAGSTPINGPGTEPVLDGQDDPAALAGPAPYNGAAPFGSPVVPASMGVGGNPNASYVDSTVGGPADQANMGRQRDSATTAFRNTVQARLAAAKKG